MNLLKNISFFTFLSVAGNLFSQNVTIYGKLDKSYWGNPVVDAYTYDDYMSYSLKKLAVSESDKTGIFSLSFEVKRTTLVLLRIDNAEASLYVEPNKKYKIGIYAKDSGAIETISNIIPVGLTFYDADSTDINSLLYFYSEKYDKFLEARKGNTMNEGNQFEIKLDTFEVRVHKKFSTYKNEYFQDHITYSLAGLQAKFKKADALYKNYVEKKPILYENEEYLKFIADFFSVAIPSYYESEKFLKLVNDVEIFDSLKTYFGKSKHLSNDTLNELAVLNSLMNCYVKPDIKKNRVINILNQASQKCKSEKNKLIAKNLSKKLGKLLVGYPAPAFELYDKNGKLVKLEDFKGKYVYISFWQANCTSCEEEMRLIPDLKKKYGNKIAFVYINLDKNPEDMKTFLMKYPNFDWYFLSCENQKTIKQDYDVLALPYYILINPEGNIVQAPAINPGIDLDKILNDLTKKK